MAEQCPAITLLSPLFAALLISLLGAWRKQICLPIVIASLVASTVSGFAVLETVVEKGEIIYLLGNWPRPYGIEFRIDPINTLLLLVISAVALMAALYSKEAVERENPDKLPSFYILYLLLVTGLMGMCLTGDAFNLYVMMEVSSLTSYALIAMGRKKAAVSSFNYLIMGTIGASFYLLGVGYLYIKTGSLNMVDIQQILEGEGALRFHYDHDLLHSDPDWCLDQNGVFPPAWMAPECLLLRPKRGRLSDCSIDDESRRIRDDTDDVHGFRYELCYRAP